MWGGWAAALEGWLRGGGSKVNFGVALDHTRPPIAAPVQQAPEPQPGFAPVATMHIPWVDSGGRHEAMLPWTRPHHPL